ncbi:molybdopterin binding oxidoreductase [Artomyces pyxidatus]|uniref:Molybdopterin binding oxidoreductase n=1 Tax=Artomyces pyxidatus TaxID=48021 RepID=A0ACB8SQE5_9AGAM|nr:molybdopterin binding oxidoreductase [Artomyces pyxidatus]
MAQSHFLSIKAKKPFNADPDVAALIEFPLTPDDLMYARNHGDIPNIDADSFTLKIDGAVERKLHFTLDELTRAFPHTRVVAAIQCAGNRRKAMAERAHQDVQGIKWGEGTIANVAWTGVRLRDVLLEAGVKLGDGMHVCFSSHVSQVEEDSWFGGSIPLEKAMDEDGDVLIAYSMNGHPLHPEHGFPFRIVVPGFSGVRWVKWLDRITVSRTESANFYQQRDYKVLPPHVTSASQADAESWWARAPPLQANPLSSAIAAARAVPGGTVLAKGYAVGGPRAQVRAVDVSADAGASWARARLTYQDGRWSWTLWEAAVAAGADVREVTLWSRATDESGETQTAEGEWNLRGLAYAAVGECVVEL